MIRRTGFKVLVAAVAWAVAIPGVGALPQSGPPAATGRVVAATPGVARPYPLMPQPGDVAKIPPKKAGMIRIALAGDSTVTNDAGWGVGFNDLLGEQVECINMARGGRSSGSFMEEGRWQQTLSLKPDYVLIQFGHNDEPGHEGRSTEPDTTYRQNMLRYVSEAKAAGIVPVLVTPLARRQWGKDDRIHSSLASYAAAVRRIAIEQKLPLIDLQAQSIGFYEKMGPRNMERLSPPKTPQPATASAAGAVVLDGTHLNAEGSLAIGNMVALELRKVVPPLSEAVRADHRYIVVAPDASGDVKMIHEAIGMIADNSPLRTIVHIKPGIYDEGQILLPASKKNVTFEGEDAVHTVLRYHWNVNESDAGAARGYTGTGVVILANDFHASNIMFENDSGNHGQALALRIDADRAVLRNCRMVGWQDTLLLNRGRQYFRDCLVAGRVDFIYGNATAVFDRCEILSRNRGHITAANTPQNQRFGFVFMNCKLTYDPAPWVNPANPDDPNSSKPDKADLGRPWREYACVAFLNCEMGDHINPAGFISWKGSEDRDKTARYSEYKSTGPGASPATRAPWVHQLTDEEAKAYTLPTILGGGDTWDPEAPELPPIPKTI